jgi:hypothetical protein
MDDHAPLGRFAAARLLVGLLGVLCLAVPLLAGPRESPKEKKEAEKVAKKVAKAAGTAHQVEAEREALRHFLEDVAEYAELHDKLVAKLGLHAPADAAETIAAQQALARAIELKRAKAKPGDLFQPDIQPLFRRLITEQLQGPDALAARKAVLEGNPEEEEGSVPVVVRVNAEYPPGAPRSTVPPSVLLTLPRLPAALHYRFVGRDLILVDSVAQIIVDFLPAAAPDLAVK